MLIRVRGYESEKQTILNVSETFLIGKLLRFFIVVTSLICVTLTIGSLQLKMWFIDAAVRFEKLELLEVDNLLYLFALFKVNICQ